MSYFRGIIDESVSRSRESTLSILGISDPGLREHLDQLMGQDIGSEESLLANPVFEHTFGWETSENTFLYLQGELLSPTLVKALCNAETHRFSIDMYPYTHQINAWEALMAKDTKSTVVTTGTGSGKTECFMIPILDDLVREYERTRTRLIGVRALFLYPLNALINSQKERLDSWTKGFENNIRFCLYNGKTVKKESRIRAEQREHSNQILSRELLRKEPAPILLTNGTMLEYMLVRQVDNPILQLSRESGSLKWIVLDEAHTYIGSQAAEISLLLRRVLHAFGKDAEDVRFIATSATMADSDSTDSLRRYLADLAGVSQERVEVITGNRSFPNLDSIKTENDLSLKALAEIDIDKITSNERYDALCKNHSARKIRGKILNDQPRRLDSLVDTFSDILEEKECQLKKKELLDWLDLLTGTRNSDRNTPFLKLRMHVFQRTMHGLWSCVDPGCKSKTSLLKEWPFGNVYAHQRDRCECGAPVYEVGFCKECRAPHLIAEDRDAYLLQRNPYNDDEFSLSSEFQDEGDNTEQSDSQAGKTYDVYLAPECVQSEQYFRQNLSLDSRLLGTIDVHQAISINITKDIGGVCSICEYSHGSTSFLGFAYLGSPFYISNLVPTVLEFCPVISRSESDGRSPIELPGMGKRLITFTDSRQGTARISVKMQQDAERSKLRGLVFESIRNSHKKNSATTNPAKEGVTPEELRKKAEELQRMGLGFAWVEELKGCADVLEGKKTSVKSSVRWSDLISLISESADLSKSILDYNRYANPSLFSEGNPSSVMAKVLLLREFSRRPKYHNSLETLGIVVSSYPQLNKITTTPDRWNALSIKPPYTSSDFSSTSLTLSDWHDYLKILIDFYIRENSFIRIDQESLKWMGSKFFPKTLLPPESKIEPGVTVKKWPYFFDNIKRKPNSRPIKILEEVTSLDKSTREDRDILNTILKRAWDDLVKVNILEQLGSGFSLRPSSMSFSLLDRAWVCPVTRKILDTTFCGVSPYLRRTKRDKSFSCEPITFPDLSLLSPVGSGDSSVSEVRDLVNKSSDITALRKQNLWTDLSDRIVEGGFYYRTAEHSAQQSSSRLEKYENMFKKGKINVLNCSTTMEMGVDIGGISAVLMNNVPPHPANYLQRAGRAGRRNESRSLAYTLCKPDPHNKRVFRNPEWPFVSRIPAPTVTLSSKRIVQRHINSLLLSMYLRSGIEIERETTTLNLEWFFEGERSHSSRFRSWIKQRSDEIDSSIRRISRSTPLEGRHTSYLVIKASEPIENLERIWSNELKMLQEKISVARDALKKALAIELRQHKSEYLLKYLAQKGFLPGYSFPTDVVSLTTYNIADFLHSRNRKKTPAREDSFFDLKEKPSRSLDIALREYAPGSQLVVDGRVYRSAGVILDWFKTDSNYHFDLSWRCKNCGTNGFRELAYSQGENIECHNCGKHIGSASQKMILRPDGFSTDFFQEPDNDISTQKYIKMEQPQVNLDAVEKSLPDIRCGSFKYGHEGGVFFHSSGEFNGGFAICLKCGRSESMLPSNELPKVFSQKYHVPLSGLNKKGKEETCSRESVKPNVYLGYHHRTDVLEIFIRNPTNRKWLGTSNEDKVIASTLAVAIRETIAESIGISSLEMGYSYRLDRDLVTREQRTAIQIYDKMSGGAGFVLSVVNNIKKIVLIALDKLSCPGNCRNICSQCLGAEDSKIERLEIDRRAALKWIEESNYKASLGQPISCVGIDNPEFCSLGPITTIKSKAETLVSHGSRGSLFLPIFLSEESSDLSHPDFFDKLMSWIFQYKLDLTLCIDKEVSVQDMDRASLENLSRRGVRFAYFDSNDYPSGFHLACHLKSDDSCYSIFTNNLSDLVLGEYWLGSRETSLWIGSEMYEPSEFIPFNIDKASSSEPESVIIDVFNVLDGDLVGLQNRLMDLISEKAAGLFNKIQSDAPRKISYSDRYLRSPWTLALLSEVLKTIAGSANPDIHITTQIAGGDYREPTMVFHNWQDSSDLRKVIREYLEETLNANVEVNTSHNTGAIQHGRVMEIEWESGHISQLIFDQGMGAWKSYFTKADDRSFDFRNPSEKQVTELKRVSSSATMQRTVDWPTYISVVVRKL